MSVLRYELPKRLEVNQIIESISNPYLTLPTNRTTKSAYHLVNTQQQIQLQNHSTQTPVQTSLGFNSNDTFMPKTLPILLNTQTNDGTTCVYYPTGQKAIVVANVFGFSVETTSSLSTHMPQASAHTNMTSMSGSFNSSNIAGNSNLTWQNLKNSFTTIVYDLTSEMNNRKSSKYSYKSFNSNSSSNLAITPRESEDNETNKKMSTVNPIKQLNKYERDAKILLIITSSGHCVRYRENGKPKFICTDIGGCLCTKQGAAYYQWKWDEMRQSDNEVLKKELFTDVIHFLNDINYCYHISNLLYFFIFIFLL